MIDVEAVRSRIPALAGSSYLNMSYGPKPTPVVDEVVRLARLTEAEGTLNPGVQAELWKRYDDAKDGVARLLGADTSEIALTRHVTEGINIVATGMDWRPGDEVIISDEEHPGGFPALDEPGTTSRRRRAKGAPQLRSGLPARRP